MRWPINCFSNVESLLLHAACQRVLSLSFTYADTLSAKIVASQSSETMLSKAVKNINAKFLSKKCMVSALNSDRQALTQEHRIESGSILLTSLLIFIPDKQTARLTQNKNNEKGKCRSEKKFQVDMHTLWTNWFIINTRFSLSSIKQCSLIQTQVFKHFTDAFNIAYN